MTITQDEIDKIYFLTHTSFREKQIINFARYVNNFEQLVDKIRKLRHPDLDKDWVLFDYKFKFGKTIYAKNVKVIEEKDIFKGTYTHLCKNDIKYLIQIIGNSGYCRNCDTQFFPRICYDNPFRDKIDYNTMKYGSSIPIIPKTLDEKYISRLLSIGVDKSILEEAIRVIHSPLEIDKALNTKNYDWNNPPPPVKIHGRLMFLYDVWTIRPVKKMGIFPNTKYFFHRCNDNIERILFNEKNLYPWCPACFTKFIPQSDESTIENYKEYISVKCYVSGSEDKSDNNHEQFGEIEKRSPEYFYLSILGLDKRADHEEIINTFRKLSKIYHPDLGGDSETFQEIVNAKNWLLNYYKKYGRF
jgi:hypothetical protein